MFGQGGSSVWLIALFSFAIIGFVIYKKRKESKANNGFLSMRKNKDEVWKTIKQFLKDNDEKGKEIVDSYVVKRRHIDVYDPFDSQYDRKNKQAEIRIRKWYFKQQKNKFGANIIQQQTTKNSRELFVVVFITKNIKTQEVDPPRCIEVEVINKRVDKKQFDRQIMINSLLNYDEEKEWIFPIRVSEKINQIKLDEQSKKVELQKQKKLQKLRLKELKRMKKNEK